MAEIIPIICDKYNQTQPIFAAKERFQSFFCYLLYSLCTYIVIFFHKTFLLKVSFKVIIINNVKNCMYITYRKTKNSRQLKNVGISHFRVLQ
jgi:hypothetical protein